MLNKKLLIILNAVKSWGFVEVWDRQVQVTCIHSPRLKPSNPRAICTWKTFDDGVILSQQKRECQNTYNRPSHGCWQRPTGNLSRSIQSELHSSPTTLPESSTQLQCYSLEISAGDRSVIPCGLLTESQTGVAMSYRHLPGGGELHKWMSVIRRLWHQLFSAAVLQR